MSREEDIMELQKGRPADTAGRMEKEIRTYDFLDGLGVEYDRVDHGPAMTMEDCKEADEILQATICKNLFLCNRQKTAFYLLMIPDTKVFHTKDLSAQIGSARLSFASPEYMEEFLDITPGSVSVMGLMNDKERRVQLLMSSMYQYFQYSFEDKRSGGKGDSGHESSIYEGEAVI